MARKTIEGWQAVLGYVAVTLGVIPLVQYAIGVRRGGLLRFVLGDDPGAAAVSVAVPACPAAAPVGSFA